MLALQKGHPGIFFHLKFKKHSPGGCDWRMVWTKTSTWPHCFQSFILLCRWIKTNLRGRMLEKTLSIVDTLSRVHLAPLLLTTSLFSRSKAMSFFLKRFRGEISAGIMFANTVVERELSLTFGLRVMFDLATTSSKQTRTVLTILLTPPVQTRKATRYVRVQRGRWVM